MGMAFSAPRSRNISAADVAAVFGAKPQGYQRPYISAADVIRAKPQGYYEPQGASLKAYKPSLRGALVNKASDALATVMPRRRANRLADKVLRAGEMLAPVNPMARQEFKQAAQSGSFLSRLGNSFAADLSVMPVVGKLAKPARDLFGYKPEYTSLLNRPTSKGKVDPNAIGADFVQTRKLTPRRHITPEDLQGGNLILTTADRTRAGGELRGLRGREFERPVDMQGGQDFIRDHFDGVWASDRPVIRKLASQAAEGGDRPAYLMPVTMAGVSGDFSHMMADTMLEQMRALPASSLKALDDRLRQGKKANTFEGLSFAHRDVDEVRDQLMNDWPGTRRADLWKHLDTGTIEAEGVSVGDARLAITDPNLAHMPSEIVGYNIGRMTPEIIDKPAIPHSTYSTQIGGSFEGSFDRPMPASVLFPDFYGSLAARGTARDKYTRALMMNKVTQPADQRWLDRVMPQWERMGAEEHLRWGRPTPFGR